MESTMITFSTNILNIQTTILEENPITTISIFISEQVSITSVPITLTTILEEIPKTTIPVSLTTILETTKTTIQISSTIILGEKVSLLLQIL